MRSFVLALGVFLALAPAHAVAAPEDTANDIAQEIMSPYCPGVTLHDCPSEAAQNMRERIAGWAEDGWSKDRILDHLESQWGDVIRATPPTEGAGLLAWLLPGLALAVGIVLVVWAVRSMARRRPPPPPPVSQSDRSRLEKELHELRAES